MSTAELWRQVGKDRTAAEEERLSQCDTQQVESELHSSPRAPNTRLNGKIDSEARVQASLKAEAGNFYKNVF